MPNRDKRSFCLGMALRLMQNRLPLSSSQKEPVAYLYNGVRLPPLPEWDKTTYPYAVIDSSGDLCVSKNSPRVENVMGTMKVCASGKTDDAVLIYKKDVATGNWEYFSSKMYKYIPLDETVWTNTDILYNDETVFMEASEPIPVYE